MGFNADDEDAASNASGGSKLGCYRKMLRVSVRTQHCASLHHEDDLELGGWVGANI